MDYIQLAMKPEPAAATNEQPPKDYTLDDGPLNFDFGNSEVWVDGEKYSGPYGSESKPGATRPGPVHSFAHSHDGFIQTGAVRDNVITFQAGGEQFEIRTMKLILGTSKGGAWNLYFRQDPSYQPKDPCSSVANYFSVNAAGSIHFGTDRLENLLPKS